MYGYTTIECWTMGSWKLTVNGEAAADCPDSNWKLEARQLDSFQQVVRFVGEGGSPLAALTAAKGAAVRCGIKDMTYLELQDYLPSWALEIAPSEATRWVFTFDVWYGKDERLVIRSY